MKKLNLMKKLSLRSFALIGILAIAVLTISCEDDVDAYTPTQEAELKSGKAVKKGGSTIAEIVIAAADTTAENPQFTLLLGALQHAGLADVFAGGDQYTVFAPTDQAFIDLVVALSPLPEADSPFEAIDMKLGEGTVANVLLYHVAEGRRAANSVLPKKNGQMRTIETLLGQTFDVNNKGMIYINSTEAASIVTDSPGETFNVSASNGIIHVIDAVLVPEL